MLDQIFSFFRTGALVPILLMLPNILWMILPGEKAQQEAKAPLWLTVLENTGRMVILVLPFFYHLDLSRMYGFMVLAVMGLALAVYYLAWGRYFLRGCTLDLMGAPLLGIPLPLVVAPVVFLLLSAYLMGSWWMFGASVIFGIAHIRVSQLTF